MLDPLGLIRVLTPSRSLRCVVFHNISDSETAFTKGLNISMTPRRFERTLTFFKRYYQPVSLQEIVTAGRDRLPERALLVTFDDAYASVAEFAVPLCREHGIPVLFFVNAAFVDNRRLALPNLACYVANVFGMRTINEAARIAQAGRWGPIETLGELSTRFLARASLDQRQAFFEALLRLNGINELQTTGAAALYITAKQLREIAAAGVEIGNHTYTHVHCRTLRQADFAAEIDRNRAELEALSNRLVRAFSVPYGSSKDLTSELAQHLERSGYDAIFLSENAANLHGAGRRRLDRLSIRGSSPYGIIRDLEILPPLRTLRNRLRVGLRQNK